VESARLHLSIASTVRASGQFPYFKIVLLTNASGLDLPAVQRGLQFFIRHDEIWAKVDAGTQAYMDRINRPQVSLEQILANILLVARKRQVVIQSLFPGTNGQEPTTEEIEAYAQGQAAWQTRHSAVLPRSACFTPVWPWVAMTIRSTFNSFAALAISSNATPLRTKVSH
jgi:hypothetical protein